jgi:hypothetical protein
MSCSAAGPSDVVRRSSGTGAEPGAAEPAKPTSSGGASGSFGTSTGGSTQGTGGATSASAGSGGSSTGTGPMPGTGGSSSVTFEWPETAPGSGTCKAGQYHGDFLGIYSPAITVFPAPIPVTGNVELTLAESADGEFFEISGGKVSGVADGLFPYSADVVGTLDCTARKLVNASLKNGKYTVGIMDYPFEGPIAADYDMLTHAFVNGTWDVKEPNPIYGGSGTWNARSVP